MKVFLSYNSVDKETAQTISRVLMQRGIDVWFDAWEVSAGESITDRVEDGLLGTDAFIILMSPPSMVSRWVREELRVALQRRLRDEDFRVIPILLTECKIPAFLQDYRYVDWRTTVEDATDELIRALKRVSPKPTFTPSQPNFGVHFTKVHCLFTFVGPRGSLVHGQETVRGIALADLAQIDKKYYWTGSLKDVSCDGLSLERKPMSDKMERWRLRHVPPLRAGSDFGFVLKYSVCDSFYDEQQEIPYSIEAPTDELVMTFDFSAASPVCDARMWLVVGQTVFPEPIDLLQDGARYLWRKIAPNYKDTYEFRFRWREAD